MESLPPKIAELSKKRFLPIKTVESLDFEEARGALPSEVYCLLMEHPNLIDEIVEYLLEKNWSPTLHTEIRQNVGLRLSSYRLMLKYPLIASLFNDEGRKRDPRFREEVLTAYGYKCCVWFRFAVERLSL
ncbi:MAG: hypothetical protein F4039_09755 [Gammaproteobacteria bacterium]|nr:hypothetical protein [Gammaproteobacteria bacterium]MXX95517.1 hypothetical protein [Gammaproteobacteria bacterium]MYF53924.1 hypothetical protein [Gammaproteobacteria bacterium]MYK44355.1 hypothetical protein [Gammaproteobacteria bacterium]